jgi:ubiquinone/menaquinone biosynthesis C-methylase UbiE
MSVEQEVARHYGRGDLEQAFLDALIASGKDPERLAAADLAAADEFHLGWLPATVELAKGLALAPGMHVLDIGAGIGGPARYLAQTFGCRVTGIDLTPDYVAVADALTRRCGLADKVTFRQASAVALPFADAGFDAATMLHVGMNIADKAKAFGEVRRVLRPGGRFTVYEVMRASEGELPYPMPWAQTPATSFVEPVDTYRRLLRAAGFDILVEHDRSELALRLGREMREKVAREGVPPLGLHILMGAMTPQRLGNVTAALERGLIAPIELVTRAACGARPPSAALRRRGRAPPLSRGAARPAPPRSPARGRRGRGPGARPG